VVDPRLRSAERKNKMKVWVLIDKKDDVSPVVGVYNDQRKVDAAIVARVRDINPDARNSAGQPMKDAELVHEAKKSGAFHISENEII
jgi:hypothetical protein